MITRDLRKKIRIGIAYVACPCLGTLLCAVLSRNLHFPLILWKEINNNKKHQICWMLELIISIFAKLEKCHPITILCYHLLISHPLSLIEASAILFPVPPWKASFPFFSEMLTDQLFWADKAWPKGAKKTRQRRWNYDSVCNDICVSKLNAHLKNQKTYVCHRVSLYSC